MILIPKSQNQIQTTGSLSLVLVDTITGKTRQEIYVPNLIVTLGKAFIASRMVGTTQAIMSHMGIGTSESTELVGQGNLIAELTVAGGYTGYTRVVTSTASASGAVVTYMSTFAAQNPSAPALTGTGATQSGGAILREAGIFNASTGGTMLCRTTFPVVTKLPADALTITWQVTIS